MPILNADKAKNVIVIKRGQGAGFSGIENGLFFLDNTRMLYGDGRRPWAELVKAIKASATSRTPAFAAFLMKRVG
jgi:NAD(P) transhydrogenase subunit beta